MKRSLVPRWAFQFIEANHQRASSGILTDFHRLTQAQQRAMVKHAVQLLHCRTLAQQEKLRNGAVRLVVALLPGTFPVLKKLLADFHAPFWYEAHFLVFSALDRDDLTVSDQRRALALVEDYMMHVDVESGFAAWKAGDMLGHEWNSPETVAMLERLVLSARHVAGRNGALHGIAHAMDNAKRAEENRLLQLVEKVALEDRSLNVKSYARFILDGCGCYRKGTKKLKRTP